MKIDRIEPSPHISGRILVFLDDGQCVKITQQELLTFGLRPGDEVDGALLTQVQAQATTSHVQATGAALVGRRAMSTTALKKKLQEKGASHADATYATEWLEAMGALDDGAYAAMLVRHYSAMGYGRRRCQEKLREKGVPREYWDDALEEAPPPDDQIHIFLEKKLKDNRCPDEKTLRRITSALMRKGYAWGDIKSALNRYLTEEAEFNDGDDYDESV